MSNERANKSGQLCYIWSFQITRHTKIAADLDSLDFYSFLNVVLQMSQSLQSYMHCDNVPMTMVYINATIFSCSFFKHFSWPILHCRKFAKPKKLTKDRPSILHFFWEIPKNKRKRAKFSPFFTTEILESRAEKPSHFMWLLILGESPSGRNGS